MTTGNSVENYLVQEATASGLADVGHYYSRVWSGVDSPPRTPVMAPKHKPEFVTAYVRVGPEYKWITYKKRFFKAPSKRLPKNVIPHPYTSIIVRRDLDWFLNRNNQYQDYTPMRYGSDIFFSPTQGWSSNDDLELLSKLRENVAGSGFNAGVFLGEGHEALTMIGDTAIKLRKALVASRHGNFVAARNYLLNGTSREGKFNKVTSNNWLELQYGWLPLLSDVHDGAEFLAQRLSCPAIVRSSVSRSRQGTVSCNNPAFDPLLHECYTRKGIIAFVSEVDPVQLSGLLDPLSVAWELLPYSFVADWFIPIGSYLSARGLAQSLTGTFVTSTKQKWAIRGVRNNSYWGAGGDAQYPSSAIFDSGISFTRTVSNSLAVPLPSPKPLEKVASWKHCANAVALLTNFLR